MIRHPGINLALSWVAPKPSSIHCEEVYPKPHIIRIALNAFLGPFARLGLYEEYTPRSPQEAVGGFNKPFNDSFADHGVIRL